MEFIQTGKQLFKDSMNDSILLRVSITKGYKYVKTVHPNAPDEFTFDQLWSAE